jgi:L-lactate dehydrogenase complex protein LldF
MRAAALVFRHPWLYALAGRAARFLLRVLPRGWQGVLSGGWARQRELPEPPELSFRETWRRRGQP